MSFTAHLVVQEEPYVINHFSWTIGQSTDTLGRPEARVQGGELHVEVDSLSDDTLHHWAMDNTKKLEGQLLILESDSQAVRRTIDFQDAFCTGLRKNFDGSGSSKGMTMSLTLSADKLVSGEVKVENEWPA